MKLKRKLKIKPLNYLIIIILLVFSVSFLMIHRFNQKIRPKMIKVIENKINKLSNDIIMDSFNSQLLNNHDINNILKITKNKEDEIIAVDFDLEKAYQISLNLTKNIKKSLKELPDTKLSDEYFLKSQGNNGYIILLPVGLASNNNYLANLGPKIPVKVTFIGNLVTGLKTKVKDYGINSALIEVYINISLSEEILIPYVSKKINNSTQILLSSQMIEGVVPDIYNGLLENSSSLINVPLK